jgi:hypothetical protein
VRGRLGDQRRCGDANAVDADDARDLADVADAGMHDVRIGVAGVRVRDGRDRHEDGARDRHQEVAHSFPLHGLFSL